MGFAGNQLPSFVIPSAIATRSGPGTGSSSGGSRAPPPPSKPSALSGSGSNLASKRGVEDLDFFIGDEALAAGRGHGYGVHYPVRHGIIENWDLMEKYWEQCIFKYLRAEPEDHCFLLVSLSMLCFVSPHIRQEQGLTRIPLHSHRPNHLSILLRTEKTQQKSSSRLSMPLVYILLFRLY